MSDKADDTASYQREMARGALTNAFGVIGKIAGPSLLIVVTRLYGADVFGLYIAATALIEMSIAFLTAGFRDAALLFVARHAEDESEQETLYQALSNALAWSLGFAGLLIVLGWTVAPSVLRALYEFGDRLAPMVRWMVLALPLLAFDRIVVAATQGLKIMKYDALVNGGLRPVALLGTSVAVWFVSPDEMGLAAAYVITQVLVAAAAVFIYTRELAWRPLGAALRHLRFNRELLAFALPQNLNTTFERFLTNIDVLMLGLFNVSATTVGLYGAGALIVREIRQIKLVFSSAFAPHIVRFYRQGDLEELARGFATTSQWIAMAAVPVLLGVAILRNDLLRLVSPEFAGAASVFMLFLLPVPYLQCSFGTAGNVVVMTGFSRLNLLNSVTTGVANVLLNLLLIPSFGLVGAAAASGLAAFIRAVMEMGEMRWILKRWPPVRRFYKPHLAGGLAALALAGLWQLPFFGSGLLARLALFAVIGLLYAGVLVSLLGRWPRFRSPLKSP
ncbi:MAG: oligosaccharide flippase family protein [Rhodothermales bacterium]